MDAPTMEGWGGGEGSPSRPPVPLWVVEMSAVLVGYCSGRLPPGPESRVLARVVDILRPYIRSTLVELAVASLLGRGSSVGQTLTEEARTMLRALGLPPDLGADPQGLAPSESPPPLAESRGPGEEPSA